MLNRWLVRWTLPSIAIATPNRLPNFGLGDCGVDIAGNNPCALFAATPALQWSHLSAQVGEQTARAERQSRSLELPPSRYIPSLLHAAGVCPPAQVTKRHPNSPQSS